MVVERSSVASVKRMGWTQLSCGRRTTSKISTTKVPQKLIDNERYSKFFLIHIGSVARFQGTLHELYLFLDVATSVVMPFRNSKHIIEKELVL